jgi:hypothetical protein
MQCTQQAKAAAAAGTVKTLMCFIVWITKSSQVIGGRESAAMAKRQR